MSAPPGTAARLYFVEETTSGTFGPWGLSSSGEPYGLRLFFDSFDHQMRKSGGRLGIQSSYPDGLYIHRREGNLVRGTLRFRKRYSGVHAVIDGWCMGDLSTNGATHFHTSITEDKFPSFSMIHHVPMTDASTLREWRLTGVHVSRVRWRHAAGQSMIQEIDLVGMLREYSTSLTSNLPGTTNGYAPDLPDEMQVSWSHASTFIINPDAIQPNIRAWQWEIINDPVVVYGIGDEHRCQVPKRGLRVLKGWMEVEQDEEWQHFVDHYGYTNATAQDTLSATWTYQGATNYLVIFDWDGPYTIEPGGGTRGPGSQTQRVFFEHPIDRPGNVQLSVLTRAGTRDGTPYAEYGDYV